MKWKRALFIMVLNTFLLMAVSLILELLAIKDKFSTVQETIQTALDTAIETAVGFTKEYLGVELESYTDLKCTFNKLNKECLARKCKFHNLYNVDECEI